MLDGPVFFLSPFVLPHRPSVKIKFFKILVFQMKIGFSVSRSEMLRDYRKKEDQCVCVRNSLLLAFVLLFGSTDSYTFHQFLSFHLNYGQVPAFAVNFS